MDQDELARHFQADMKHAVDRMIRELNYRPTAFLRMMDTHGAVGAAKRLLESRSFQYGFEKPFERRRLEWSVEAHVILPWYQPLFTVDEVLDAEERLSLVDFDPMAFESAAQAPDWLRS